MAHWTDHLVALRACHRWHCDENCDEIRAALPVPTVADLRAAARGEKPWVLT